MHPDTPQRPPLDALAPGQEGSSEAFETDQSARDAPAHLTGIKDRVVEEARGSIRRARDSAASSLTDSRRQAADQVGGVANALRRTSEHLRSDDHGSLANLAESLSQHADRASSYIRDSDLGKMRQDVERLAREKPGAVLGASLVLGLLAARFLRSSQARSAVSGGRNA